MASKLNIIEQIVRNKVYNSSYWKEKCFALTSETIIDNALELEYIGGIISTTNQPSDFICLLVKLIQLNPSEEIIDECGNKYYGVYFGNMDGEKYYY